MSAAQLPSVKNIVPNHADLCSIVPDGVDHDLTLVHSNLHTISMCNVHQGVVTEVVYSRRIISVLEELLIWG